MHRKKSMKGHAVQNCVSDEAVTGNYSRTTRNSDKKKRKATQMNEKKKLKIKESKIIIMTV